MNKSYNDIKAQEKRVRALCVERGRYCDNAKGILDTQHIAQISRRTLLQHGFPIFGNFNPDEKRAYKPSVLRRKEEPRQQGTEEVHLEQPPKRTPTEEADERVRMSDWMTADEKNRRWLQNTCRHAFIKKMYAELLTDMEICRLEGWDIFEFPLMLRDALQVCLPRK